MSKRRPMILVFAGPNGSGKSSITEEFRKITPLPGTYVNADIIKQERGCSDLEAAQEAERIRNDIIALRQDLSFETVLSTRRNLDLLIHAHEEGYFIKAFYVITVSPKINVERVRDRMSLGGHFVPKETVVKRYYKALELIPELISVCDVIHIYDNSGTHPERIFKKKREDVLFYSTDIWSEDKILQLVGNRASH